MAQEFTDVATPKDTVTVLPLLAETGQAWRVQQEPLSPEQRVLAFVLIEKHIAGNNFAPVNYLVVRAQDNTIKLTRAQVIEAESTCHTETASIDLQGTNPRYSSNTTGLAYTDAPIGLFPTSPQERLRLDHGKEVDTLLRTVMTELKIDLSAAQA